MLCLLLKIDVTNSEEIPIDVKLISNGDSKCDILVCLYVDGH